MPTDRVSPTFCQPANRRPAGALTANGRILLLQVMDHTRRFRELREERGLTREQLASLAGCHRNTVINIETGRPVRFRTIADLLQRMGYAEGSEEMKQLALLWLAGTTGVRLTPGDAQKTAERLRSTYRRSVRASQEDLNQVIESEGLSRENIDLLKFAARHPEVRSVLRTIRDLVAHAAAAPPDAPELKVAEK